MQLSMDPSPTKEIQDPPSRIENVKASIANIKEQLAVIDPLYFDEIERETVRESVLQSLHKQKELLTELLGVHQATLNRLLDDDAAAEKERNRPRLAPSIVRNGLPELGAPYGSPTVASIPFNHLPAELRVGEFKFSRADFKVRDVDNSGIYAIHSGDWSTASDIQYRVRAVLDEVIRHTGLPLKCMNELSVFEHRRDIWSIWNNGRPVGVVGVRRPGGAGVQHEHIYGEIYDYMLRLQSFHGLQHVFGLVSSYEEWLLCYLDGARDVTRSDQAAELVGAHAEPGQTVRAPDAPDDVEQPDGNCTSAEMDASRIIYSPGVLKWNDPKLLFSLVSLLAKMYHSPVSTVKEIDNHRPYLVLTSESVLWRTVTWSEGFRLNRQRLPRAKELYLLRDLRGGRDGRVWAACSQSGLACAIKFAREPEPQIQPVVGSAAAAHDDARIVVADLPQEYSDLFPEKPDQLLCACLYQELLNHKALDQMCRLEKWGGKPALVMRYGRPVDFKNDAVREEVRSFINEVVKVKMVVPLDIKPEHMLYFSPVPVRGGGAGRPSYGLCDLADLRCVSDKDSVEDVADLWAKKLQL